MRKIYNEVFKLASICAVVICLTSCLNTKPYYDKNYKTWDANYPPDTSTRKYSVFLIGDAGNPDKSQKEGSLATAATQIFTQVDTSVSIVSSADGLPPTEVLNLHHTSLPNSAVIFLGDNIYYKGLPEETDGSRKEMERRIIEQMDIVKPFSGKKFFIAGNHDWNESLPRGLEAVIRQENFVEAYLDSSDVFVPSNGCPGPISVQMSEDLVTIFIDSEWWLYRYEKPIGNENGCDVEDNLDFITQLHDVVSRNKNKHILICLHHPLMTNGNHGGHYTLKDHLFPLTMIRENLYIPLPIIGSIYPLMRKYGISRQDLSNPFYKNLSRAILSVVEEYPNVVVAAGHEHSLQFHKHNKINHIVSGSGCKTNYVLRRSPAIYSQSTKGFARLDYYDNGQVWVEYYEPGKKHGDKGKLTFRIPLYSLPKDPTPERKDAEFTDYSDSTIVVAAGPQYQASKHKELWLGEHYRTVWGTPVKVEYLDLLHESGGLTPTQLGGGQQTISLRLVSKDSIEYTLRTISKDPTAVIPENFRETFAHDFVEDQISSAHPFGALAVTGMANAIGIYHTKPKLVYVPNSPQLKEFLPEMGGKLAILEVRPDEDRSAYSNFGNSKNIVSTRKMFEELYKDNDNKVDQKMFCRSRLFDMLLGDWDRHEDQWRWAEGEVEAETATETGADKSKSKIYRPIPRDRDQVFVKFDGVIPYIMTRKWGVRNFRTFDYKFDDLIGLAMGGTEHLDRNLLTSLTEQDWINVADSMKMQLTDSVIENSVRGIPAEVFAVSGQELIDKLKSRRDQLPEVARRYYRILAQKVDIVGSNKHEFYHISRSKNETTVSIYKKKKESETQLEPIYHRIFKNSETKEITIYGLDGRDSFLIDGNVKRGIKVRIVGGEGNDDLIDSSRVAGFKKRNIYYDQNTQKNNIFAGHETKLKISSKYWANEFDRQNFKYDYFGPQAVLEYNKDDGIFIGGGILSETYGFRKKPYKTSQKILLSFATLTGAYNFRYEGNFYSFFGRNWDMALGVRSLGPRYVFNYFGQGNESTFLGDERIGLYRFGMEKIDINPMAVKRITDNITYGIGPAFEYMDVDYDSLPFYVGSRSEIPQINSAAGFAAAKFFGNVNLVSDLKDPTRGGRWRGEVNYYQQIKGSGSANFANINSYIAGYLTPDFPFRLTAAMRIGAATNVGKYNFYQANTLGGTTNLRGFRRTRFAGRTALYQNSELRLRVFNIRNYVLTGNAGFLGFFDAGRVWADGEKSSIIHMAYGPGVFINFYSLFLFSITYGFSDEGQYMNGKVGFFF